MRSSHARSTALAILAALTLATAGAHAQAGPERPAPAPAFAASSFASVEVHLDARRIAGEWYAEDAALTGPARIAITYGQPHARGRKVVGGLIPTDSVWRFGANAATTLHTDVDLTLGTVAVPKGDYALFIVHGADGWQLIVNGASATWGTEYDRARDVGRTTLVARTRAEPEDALSVYLVPESARPASGLADLRGRLRIVWGTTELSTTWRVAP